MENLATLEKAYTTEDYTFWPDTLEGLVNDDLLDEIYYAIELVNETDSFSSISISVDGFLTENSEDELSEEVKCDVQLIKVYSHSAILYVQGKYDSRLNAEYTIHSEAIDELFLDDGEEEGLLSSISSFFAFIHSLFMGLLKFIGAVPHFIKASIKLALIGSAIISLAACSTVGGNSLPPLEPREPITVIAFK